MDKVNNSLTKVINLLIDQLIINPLLIILFSLGDKRGSRDNGTTVSR